VTPTTPSLPTAASTVAPPTSASPHRGYDEETQAALRLWVTLSRAQSTIAAHILDDARADGISPSEFGVLELLYHKGPTLLGEIQRSVLVSSGGITFLVDRLTEKGLVERKDCPSDRRARYAALTTEGEHLMQRLFPKHARRLVEAMAALTPREQRGAADMLKRLGLHVASLTTEK
jgi:MarR family transcriptional regulator, 2-MHQ and catechol-resistance regulon repressor